MIKVFLIILSFPILAFSSQQIILVVADDFNTSNASLSTFEDGEAILSNIPVNIGKRGLGWWQEEQNFSRKTDEPIKQEGDKKAPAGIFQLTHIFSYHKLRDTKLPFLHATKELICVDDTLSQNYNRIITDSGEVKSFERMLRDDGLYEYGIVVGYNPKGVKKAGSCIFLHIERGEGAATVGCTSMKKDLLVQIIEWLDERKNPILIQVPRKYLQEVYKKFPQLTQNRFKL